MLETVHQKTIKWIWLAVAAGIAAIFLRLAFYNCPQSDDFFYGQWMQKWGFADANITIYFAWGGRYFSNIILTLCNSLGYSSDYREFLVPYQLHSVIHLVLFVLSTMILMRRIRFFSGLWPVVIPLIFFLKDAASISEFLFWLAGTATYCSGYIFGAIALAAAIDLHQNLAQKSIIRPDRKDWIWMTILLVAVGALMLATGSKNIIAILNKLPILSLFIFWLGIGMVFFLMLRPSNGKITEIFFCLAFGSLASAGASELAGVLLIICLFMVWLWFISRKAILNPLFHLPMMIAVAALALNVLAPATANREETLNPELISNWANASQGALGIFFRLFHSIPLFVAGILISLSCRNGKGTDKKQLYRHLLFFGLFQLLANGLLPLVLLLKAGELPLRAVNLHQLSMYLTVFVLAYHLGQFLKSKVLTESKALIVFSLSTPLLLGISMGRDNLKESIRDLSSGRAQTFFMEFCREQEMILECRGPVCEVEPLTSKPFCISSMSNAVIRNSDPPSWVNYKNNSYAAFYGKKEIFRRASN